MGFQGAKLDEYNVRPDGSGEWEYRDGSKPNLVERIINVLETEAWGVHRPSRSDSIISTRSTTSTMSVKLHAPDCMPFCKHWRGDIAGGGGEVTGPSDMLMQPLLVDGENDPDIDECTV